MRGNVSEETIKYILATSRFHKAFSELTMMPFYGDNLINPQRIINYQKEKINCKRQKIPLRYELFEGVVSDITRQLGKCPIFTIKNSDEGGTS